MRDHLLGVISDTHGLIRPEALAALRGVSRILHAGDVGRPHVLEALSAIAEVTAVRGNNDSGPWARGLPDSELITVGAVRIYMIHDVKELAVDPIAEGIGVVISGHSHRPSDERRGGVLYLNPGSAGPRRFSLPVTVARLSLSGGRVRARLVDLVPPAAPR